MEALVQPFLKLRPRTTILHIQTLAAMSDRPKIEYVLFDMDGNTSIWPLSYPTKLTTNSPQVCSSIPSGSTQK